MKVRATHRITEPDFNDEALWVHAELGEEGEVVHTDNLGYKTVRFFRTGTATVVAHSEISDIAEEA
jgi:hypothetical protein